MNTYCVLEKLMNWLIIEYLKYKMRHNLPQVAQKEVFYQKMKNFSGDINIRF